MRRKCSVPTSHYRSDSSQHAARLASFRLQMADFARGEELRRLRDERHLSQEDAAYEIGVSVKTVRSWEHGGKIKWENAQRVAKFYAVDPESLVSRDLPVDRPDQLHRIEQAIAELHAELAELRTEIAGASRGQGPAGRRTGTT